MRFHSIQLLAAASLLLLGRPSVWAEETTFVVNTIADFSGTDPKLSASGSNGNISLRSAIEAADNQPGSHTITFNILDGGTNPQIEISGSDPLPEITSRVDIDATTQPGLAANERVGLVAAPGSVLEYGLFITNGLCSVRGLDIENFIEGILLTNGGVNVIQANRLANNVDGIYIGPDASANPDTASYANVIGGTDSELQNVIVSNNFSGIYMYDSAFNGIQGNWIGVDYSGTGAAVAAGNLWGMIIDNSDNNLVGGNGAAGAGNVISSNTTGGLLITGGQGNSIYGNIVGTTPDGTGAMGNGLYGIVLCSGDDPSGGIRASSNNKVGASSLNATGNLISGNLTGVLVTTDTTAIGSNKIQGNYIGTDAAGKVQVHNIKVGIEIAGSSLNLIGGTKPGQGNVVSGNGTGIGITDQAIPLNTVITGTAAPSATFSTVLNFVRGNLVGTTADGKSSIPNLQGIGILGASESLIGGTTKGSGNIVANNIFNGIGITGGINSDSAVDNAVEGNTIKNNGANGVYLGPGAAQNQIGGFAKGAGNTITDNNAANGGLNYTGVYFTNSGSNAVLGNSISGNGGGSTGYGIASPSKATIVLNNAAKMGNATLVTWTLTDPANPAKTKYRIQFFSNPSNEDQGAAYVEKALATLGAGSLTSGTTSIKGAPTFITATATQLGKKGVPLLTSNFSNVVTP